MARRIGIVSDLHFMLRNPSSRKDSYYEACFQKFEFILNQCDTLILLGDVFDKARTEDIVKNRILTLLNAYKKKVYVIPGNHDIEHDNIETLPNTSLGNLVYHNCVCMLTPERIWNIDGLTVGVLEYKIEEAKKQEFQELDIVIGHHAYEWGRDLSQGLEESDILRYNARFAFFGHDHQPYEPKQVGKTIIYRTGSIMRDALNAYTPNHHPSFMLFEEKNGSYGNPCEIEIPHNPVEDAFRIEEKKIFKKCNKLVSEIKNFLQGVKMDNSNKKTVGQILREDLNAPKEVVDYLQLVYRVNHLEF